MTRSIGLLVLAYAAACAPSAPTGPVPEAVVCAWDVSTSMRPALEEAGREVCVREVERLERGWISVRVIGAGSYANESEIAYLDLTSRGGCTNPFSARCRRSHAQVEAAAEAKRRDAISRVRAYVPDRSARAGTDIDGALAAAEDALRAVSDSAWHRRAVLATDLVPSAATTPVVLDLSAIQVDVWVQWPADATAGRRLRGAFERRLRDSGADVISYHSLTALEP